jgi:hypothetical protein
MSVFRRWFLRKRKGTIRLQVGMTSSSSSSSSSSSVIIIIIIIIIIITSPLILGTCRAGAVASSLGQGRYLRAQQPLIMINNIITINATTTLITTTIIIIIIIISSSSSSPSPPRSRPVLIGVCRSGAVAASLGAGALPPRASGVHPPAGHRPADATARQVQGMATHVSSNEQHRLWNRQPMYQCAKYRAWLVVLAIWARWLSCTSQSSRRPSRLYQPKYHRLRPSAIPLICDPCVCGHIGRRGCRRGGRGCCARVLRAAIPAHFRHFDTRVIASAIPLICDPCVWPHHRATRVQV